MSVCALVIAASDPSGGAGIEADIKVLQVHGVFALTALTASTIQDTRAMQALSPTGLEAFRGILGLQQNDQPISAVKTGALATAGHLEAVRDFLAALDPLPPVIIDPVMKASSGPSLLDADEPARLIKSLLPFAQLVIPNLAEAAALTGLVVNDPASMSRAAKELCAAGAKAALIKGGHLSGEPRDLLCYQDEISEFGGERLPHDYHGSGCVLASAIAANLARGAGLVGAVKAGRRYLRRCMEKARPGKGRAYILDFPPAP